MDLKEYDQQLQRHDWFWSYSDDGSVRRAGEKREALLFATAQESPQHLQLYRAWSKYRNDCSAQTEGGRERLQAARLELGVISQAEIDTALQRERQKKLEERQKLVRFNRVCEHHDWFYWKNNLGTREYQQGLEDRVWLTSHLSHFTPTPYDELFRAWAHYFNQRGAQALEQLDVVLKKYQLNDN